MASSESSGLLNKIFLGEVSAVHHYGAFVKIPGMARTQGLIHKSQISSSSVDDATEVLEKDEKVWCKVVSISDGNKIGLSMKVVDQGSGRDLDPNGVQMSLDAQRRKENVGRGEPKAITLEAVLNTTCSKCGIQGHLAKNCFKTPEGKVYDLLPEPEPVKKLFGSKDDQKQRILNAGFEPGHGSEEGTANKSFDVDKKAQKKSKKSKSRRRSSSSSSDVEKKSKKKRKKQKKKRKSLE